MDWEIFNMSNQISKRWALSISYTTLSTIVATPIIVLLPTSTHQAFAESNYYQKPKVAICHRTNSVKNPYVELHIDKNAYDGQPKSLKNKSDHLGQHKGPVVISEKEARELKSQKTKWGDVYIGEISRTDKKVKVENTSENCEVEKAPDVIGPKEHPKNYDKPNKDDCKEDEPKVIEDEVNTTPEVKEEITIAKAETQVSIPKVLAESTNSEPRELANTGVSSLIGILVGSSIISTVLSISRIKPAKVKN